MREIYFNQYEQVVSNDLNNTQLGIQQSLYEYFLYNYFAKNNGVLGSSFVISYSGSTTVGYAGGIGFYYDSSKVDPDPKYRMIRAVGSGTLSITTPDSSHDRIDVVWVKPDFYQSDTASRYIKSGGVGPITLTSVAKGFSAGAIFGIVAGTPAGSPTVPSTPAGAIALAQIRVHQTTGITGSGDITDVRNTLTFAVSNAGHNYLTSASLQGQLDNTDTVLSQLQSLVNTSTGGTIGATLNATWILTSSPALTLPVASAHSKLKMTFKNAGPGTIDIGPNGGDLIEGVNADIFLAAGDSVTLISDGTSWWDVSIRGITVKSISSNTSAARPVSVYICDVSGGNITLQLPGITGAHKNWALKVKNKSFGSANHVLIAPGGADLLEGSNTNQNLNAGETISLVCDGTSWFLV